VAFVITGLCIDVKDRSCVDVCPVDCIYEGERKLYVHPDECIDCAACEPACPVDAIMPAEDVPSASFRHVADNAAFFEIILAGRSAPLGSPGGAAVLGAVAADTPLVREHLP
jgi:NAD-dependent dihydropyrimidine dehydrogenase PreA subunit